MSVELDLPETPQQVFPEYVQQDELQRIYRALHALRLAASSSDSKLEQINPGVFMGSVPWYLDTVPQGASAPYFLLTSDGRIFIEDGT